MCQILFQKGGGDFYGDFSDVATGLWRGLFESYAVSQVVPMVLEFHLPTPCCLIIAGVMFTKYPASDAGYFTESRLI